MRFGNELGLMETLTKPRDIAHPKAFGDRIYTSGIERFYIRLFGYPNIAAQMRSRKILKILNKIKIDSALELGCAQGMYTRLIAKKFNNISILGIDLREEEVKFAKELTEKLGLKQILFENKNILEISNTIKYDFILMSHVLEHIEQDDAVIKIIANCLNEEGYFLLVSPNIYDANKNNENNRIDGHVRDGYSIEEIEKLVKVENLQIIKAEYEMGLMGKLLFNIEKYFLDNRLNYQYALIFPVLSIFALFDIINSKNLSNRKGLGLIVLSQKQSL